MENPNREITDLTADVDDLSYQLERADIEINDLKKERDDLVAKREGFEDDLQDLKEQLACKIAELTDEKTWCAEEISGLEARVEESDNAQCEAENEATRLKCALADLALRPCAKAKKEGGRKCLKKGPNPDKCCPSCYAFLALWECPVD